MIYYFYNKQDEALLELINNQHQHLESDDYTRDKFDSANKNIWTLMKGIALYRKEMYDDAIILLQKYQPDIEFQAPADIAVIAQKYTYLAMNEERLNNKVKAQELIQIAKDKIKNIPSNHFTKITEDTYKRIMNKNKPTD